MSNSSATITPPDAQTETQPKNKLKRVFRHRDFRLLWAGAFLSFCGSWIQTVAQGFLVYQLTGSKFLLALVGTLGMLPVTLFGIFAGSLVDTLNKRTLLIIAQSVYAINALYMASATYFGFIQYWHILVIAVVTGMVSCIEMPTRQSITSRVVPPEDLPIAIPINGLTFNMARPLGSAIGGLLLTAFGPEACYLVNGISFFALIFAVLAIRSDLAATAREPQPIWDLVAEGALYTFRDIRLRTLLILESSVSVFGLFYIVQIPAIAQELLGRGEQLGEAYFATGLGSALALVAITMLIDKPIKAIIVRTSVISMGLLLILLSLSRTPWLSYIIFALLGLASVSLFNTCNTLFQTLSPERLRGRVISMHIWALSGAAPIGIFASGYLAQRAGLPAALQCGAALVLLVGIYGLVFRKGLEGVR